MPYKNGKAVDRLKAKDGDAIVEVLLSEYKRLRQLHDEIRKIMSSWVINRDA